MDFNDTPEEAAYRSQVAAWLEDNAEPLGPGESRAGLHERHKPGMLEAAVAWQAKKAAAGWACITWPREYGGRGERPLHQVIWEQEESRFRVQPDFFTIGIGVAGPMLMVHGTDEQKARWLPSLTHGDELWCQLFSEPAAGSDLASLRTRAVRDGDAWVVNGQKIWSSGAHYSKWAILVARSDPDVPKHAGLTFFVLDMESPGVEVRPIRQITGASHFNEVFLTDVRIPDENRISAAGNGWAVVITTLSNERSSIGSGAFKGPIGVQGLIAMAREIRDERGPLLDDTGVCERIADFYVRTRGIELGSFRTLTLLSQGQVPGSEIALGKLVGAKLQQDIAALGVELQGTAGTLQDPGATAQDGSWQTAYLFSPGVRIAGGTDEILRNVIGERVLGLPPEPRLDKAVRFREIPTGAGT